jgi:hypothetical protein
MDHIIISLCTGWRALQHTDCRASAGQNCRGGQSFSSGAATGLLCMFGVVARVQTPWLIRV